MSSLTHLYQSSRKSSDLCVIEGFHSIKHALRFEAKITSIHTSNPILINQLIDRFCPDLKNVFKFEIVSEEEFEQLSPTQIHTSIIAIAHKPTYKIESIPDHKPVVFLEDIKNPSNLGTIIRVCAARDLGAVCYSGNIDPFVSMVTSTSRGLNFAIPVIKCDLSEIDRDIVSFDENGTEDMITLPQSIVLVFGTERHGISEQTKQKSKYLLRIPMKKGVSSLNISNSVAIAIYKYI
jgi:RNA methyltransferase, TrmH family